MRVIPLQVARVQQSWKCAREQRFQSGQAGANNSCIDFSRRPNGGERIVPRHVRVVKEDKEGFEAEDGD